MGAQDPGDEAGRFGAVRVSGENMQILLFFKKTIKILFGERLWWLVFLEIPSN